MTDVIIYDALTGTKTERDYTAEELADIESRQPTALQLWADYQAKAQALLDKTDLVCIRCYKIGIPYPSEWLDYTNKLRDIIRAAAGDSTAELPLSPIYPVGS